MAKLDNISADLVRQLLDFNPETGVLTWRSRTPEQFKGPGADQRAEWFNKALAGTVAGRRSHLGYIEVRVHSVRRAAHRLAWLHVHGRWPNGEVDHIDGDKSNNRLSNLREATRAQNRRNVGKTAANSTGVKCVQPINRGSRYRLVFGWQGMSLCFASYKTIEAAKHDRDVLGPWLFGQWWRGD